jgi:pimeloyl-ACP methyl ester carboxylesterase
VNYPNASPAVSASGLAFRYAQGSDPTLPPIILLHGLSQQSDFWLPVVDALGSRYTTVSIDLRGHGESRHLPPDYRIAQVAQDCINLADELGIISACVVGHSWGASIALNIAAKFPLRSRSCVLIDGGAFTPANILESGSITRGELITALTPPLGPFTDDELNSHYLSSHIGLSAGQQRSIMSAIKRSYTPAPQGGWVTTIGFERHMGVVEAFLEYNPNSDLTSVGVPTWILMARDAFAPAMTNSTDSWADARAQVNAKVRGKSNIALQHWYGAVHDVPLYWPNQVSQLISHAVSHAQFIPGVTSVLNGKDTLA